MRLRAIAMAVMLVAATFGMVAAPTALADEHEDGAEVEADATAETYEGTHVTFEARDDAVAGYNVTGDVLLENVTVRSAEDAYATTDAEADVAAVADANRSAVEGYAEGEANATVRFESGARMEAHDTPRGVIQVHADGDDQFVQAEVGEDVQATADTEWRVVLERDDEAQGAFVVIGDGEVAVTDDGHVNADVSEDARLVYRQYDAARTDADAEAERLIADGTATAEVYVGSGDVNASAEGDGEATTGNESATETDTDDSTTDDGTDEEATPTDEPTPTEDGSDADADDGSADNESDATTDNRTDNGTESAADGEATAAHVIEYGEEVDVEVVAATESGVELTAEREAENGTVLLTSLDAAAVEDPEAVQVTVDGEAAAEAETYADLEAAATGGEEHRFLVEGSTSTEATTDVAVAIGSFSERHVELTSADDAASAPGEDGTPTDDDGTPTEEDDAAEAAAGPEETVDDGAGFGALVALVALGAALLATRRR